MTNLADLLPAGGGQNNTDFVADGNISAGVAVILTAAGKAAAITGSAGSVGTSAVFESATSAHMSATYDSTNNKVVICYRDDGNSYYGTAVVATVSGDSISFGTPAVFSSSSTMRIAPVFDTYRNRVVIIYKNDGDGSKPYGISGAVSGTSISFATAGNISGNSCDSVSACFDSVNNQTIFSYARSSDGQSGAATVDVSGGIGFGSTASFLVGGAPSYTQTVFDPDTSKAVVFYTDSVDSYKGKARVITNSSGTITFGTEATMDSSAFFLNTGADYDTSADKMVIAFADQNNSNYGFALVGTVSGTDITFGTITQFVSGNMSAGSGEGVPVIYDSSLNKSIVAFKNATDGDIGQFTELTVSGTSVTGGSLTTFQSGSGVTYVSGAYDANANKTVLAYTNLANSNYGTGVVITPNTSTLTSTNLLGIASGAISDTATGTINTWGSRNEVQTGLTIGSDYYVQEDGRIEAGVTSIAFDISSATYTQNFDISAQATIPQAIAFNPTGTKMFIVDIAGQDVNEYALSTGFDVSSASYTQNFSVASQDTAPTGISFNAAGTKMFVCGYTNDKVYEYTLSSGFDLSTASYAQDLDVSGQDTLPKDVVFNTDGTKMFVLGGTGEDVNEYTLSAYDISTASFVDSFSVASQESAPDGIAFNTDGTKMFIVGNTDSVFQYNLSSGFDVSTASYASISFSVTSQETGPTGIAFSADGKKMFIVGTQGDDVNEYATTANSFSTTYLIGKAITATQINIKDYTG